jgi:aspartate ammonia-lyase
VVVAMWVRLGYLLHNVFSSSVIPRKVNPVICAGTNCIDIRAMQRDDLSVSKGA